MSLKYEISGEQTDGARDYQEDSFLSAHLQAGDASGQISLIIVADGMGGHAAGNVASNLAVESFNKYIATNYPADSISALLKDAVNEANKAIVDAIKETSALKGMGCTLVAALCINNKMYSVSVGDSHLFHVRNKKLIKCNADHSYGGYLDRMAAEGNEVSEESGYSRHMLLSALTGEPIPAIDCPEEPITLEVDDQILLCSDGIDTLDQNAIQESSNKSKTAKELSSRLLEDVKKVDLPRQDNTTVIALRVMPAESDKEQTVPEIIIPSGNSFNIKNPAAASTRPSRPLPANARINSLAVKNDSSSWGLPAIVIIALAAGGWWYLRENPAIIANLTPDLAEPIEKEQDTPPPPTVTTVETTEVAEPVAVEHKVVTFNDSLARGGFAPEMVWIPAGEYKMGGSGSTPPESERPSHQVILVDFAISSKEVTRGDFSHFSGVAVSKTNKDQPVRNVSWNVATKYTKWLSKQTGQTYRLPSESEWEYSARAGTTSPYWWGHNIGTNNALCFGCSMPLEPTRPNNTASFSANKFGLFDSAGNVAEWVSDCFHENYEGAPTDGSSWNDTASCNERVVRGGSYVNASKSLYVSRRDKLSANKSRKHIGFRIVREK